MSGNKLIAIILLAVFAFALALPAAAEDNRVLLDEGMKLYLQKDWAQARDKFYEAVKQSPDNPLAIMFLLSAAIRAADLQPLIQEFQKKALDNPNDHVAQAQLGFTYMSRGLYDRDLMENALEELQSVAKADPSLSLPYSAMGLIYFEKRMMPRAKGYFLKSLHNNPEDVISLEYLGNILMIDEKKYPDALEMYTKITKIVPNYPDGYFFAGSCLERMEKFDEAVEYFKKCMELDPNGVMKGYFAPRRIADIYYQLGDNEEAVVYYQKALELSPDSRFIKERIESIKKGEPKPEKEDVKKNEK
ncbi:MAG: tetratricopeptide repeat protein [Chloroflexi bacterium]|nr:tetratricopeptide repeat protein [Chloroflexota bacterium]